MNLSKSRKYIPLVYALAIIVVNAVHRRKKEMILTEVEKLGTMTNDVDYTNKVMAFGLNIVFLATYTYACHYCSD